MKYLIPVFWTLVGCSFFLLLQLFYKYFFYYTEPLQLFLYTETYASDVIVRIGGLSLYMARFLVQFYLFPIFGALCNAVLLTTACLLSYKILKKITSSPYVYLLSLLPACALLGLHLDIHYNLQGTIAYLWMLSAVLCYQRIRPPVVRLIAGSLLSILLFWIAGATAILFAAMALLLDAVDKKPKALFSVIYLLILFLAGFAALRSGWQGEYRQVFLPDAYYEPLLRSKTIYLAWIALPTGLLIAAFLQNRKKDLRVESHQSKSKKEATNRRMILRLSVQFVLFVCFLCLMSQQHNGVFYRNMKQDYYLRTKQWDRIIAEFPGERKSDLQTFNVLNLALAMKGALGSQLFNYNTQGYKTLLADWNSSLPNAIALSDIFYHIGDIGSAQKFAFEGVVASPNEGNVRLLIRLIETNILFGEYPVAEKYIALLERTLFYKTVARDYRPLLYNDALVEQNPVLGAKRKALVQNDVYAVSNRVMNTLESLAVNDPANPLAMQYLLAICLTNKDLVFFKKVLDRYLRTPVLPVLSPVQQEAAIALDQNNPLSWIKNGVDTKTEQRFRAFDDDIRNRNVPDFEGKMKSAYGNTYWYYVLFNTYTNNTNENSNQSVTDYLPRRL